MSAPTDRIDVLHVDDEPGFADMTSQFLERHEDQIDVWAETGPSAGLARLRDVDIDCIVSDYDMPRRNGIEFLETVREKHPDLPFILFTGKGTEEVASDAISAGVTEYLQKGSGTDQYTVLANRIVNAVESYWSQEMLDTRDRELRRYEQMINSMHEATCIYDEDGRFELVNQYLADWYDTSREDLEGERSPLLHYIGDQAENDPIQELLDRERDHVTGTVEAEFPRHGFAVLDYRVTRLAVEGKEEKLVGIARDITDQKQKREERHREEKRHQQILQHISDYVMIVDESGKISYASPAIERMLGYAPEDVVGTDGFDYVHPDDKETAWKGFQETLEGAGDEISVEYRVQTSEGEYRWIAVRGTNKFSDPVIEGVLVNVRDITRRKERQQELELVWERMNDAVFVHRDDGPFMFVNQTAVDRYGYDEPELLEMTPDDLDIPAQAAYVPERLQ